LYAAPGPRVCRRLAEFPLEAAHPSEPAPIFLVNRSVFPGIF
jgi:hypothetical protein